MPTRSPGHNRRCRCQQPRRYARTSCGRPRCVGPMHFGNWLGDTARGGQNSARVWLGAGRTGAVGEYRRVSGYGPGVSSGAGRSRHHRTRRPPLAGPSRVYIHPSPPGGAACRLALVPSPGRCVVEPAAVSPFDAWDNFYVIIGSSGAALTGLQFVVIALGAETPAGRRAETVGAFGTPTVVHFCAALLISALLSMPWHVVSSAALAIGTCGAAGIGYALIVFRRARRQTAYAPVLEDWLWHCAFPFIAYAALLVAALMLQRDAPHSLFVIAATALLLLFVGIHNAWDAVTYIAATRRPAEANPPRDPRAP